MMLGEFPHHHKESEGALGECRLEDNLQKYKREHLKFLH